MAASILAPIGAAPVSEAKMSVALEQARAMAAPLVLLHVLPPRERHDATVTTPEAVARATLDALATRLRLSGADATTIVRTGSPAATIVEVADTIAARMIVLGSTIRSPFSRVLMSSVADTVIRAAPCPVLLVRSAERGPHSPPLLPLDPPELLTPHDLGVRHVDVNRIVGSATRAHELSTRFRPLHPVSADEQRFQQLVIAMARGDDVPPVELYKYGFGYYVRDGHHRVAAALELRRAAILASVTELVAAENAAARETAEARRRFEAETGLERIGATRAESYRLLFEEIRHYRRDQGTESLPAAAAQWFEAEFQPLRQRVRTEGQALLRPGERPADVVARAAAWRREESARHGALPAWDAAFRHIATAPTGARA